MNDNIDFERQLLALDQDKLEAIFNKVITYYLENINSQGQDDYWARHDAISEVIADAMAVADP